MKKSILITLLLALFVFSITGCIVQIKTSNNTDPIPSLEGTYTSNNKILKISQNMASISQSTTSRETAPSYLSCYHLAVDEKNKQMIFSLTGLYNPLMQQTLSYQEYIEENKQGFVDAKNKINTALDNNSDYKSALKNFNDVNSGYGNLVDTLVREKIGEYLEKEETILADYLTKMFASKIIFDYSLTSTNLRLTQQFQNNLSDASSGFLSSDATLNDFKNLIPFAIKLGENNFFGIPEIKNGNIKADLFQYTDFLIEDSDSLIQQKVNSWVNRLY